jgi:hypothetical protein
MLQKHSLLEANKVIGLKIKSEITRYMFMSRI